MATLRVERAQRVLGHQYLDRRSFPHGRQQIIGQRDAERLAALVVAEFFVKRAAETLHEAAVWLRFVALLGGFCLPAGQLKYSFALHRPRPFPPETTPLHQ